MLTFSIKYRKRIHERYVSPKYNPICSNSSLVPAVHNQTQQALNIESMFVPVSERGQDHKLSCMRFSNVDRKFAGISKFTSKLLFFCIHSFGNKCFENLTCNLTFFPEVTGCWLQTVDNKCRKKQFKNTNSAVQGRENTTGINRLTSHLFCKLVAVCQN